MQTTSNSLFHFTYSIDILSKIFQTKFYGSYCKEQFECKSSKEEILSYTIYVPKISFCDIPEETINKYTSYGKYCIGLSKEWAKRNRLNPVLYIENNSIIAESFIRAFKGTPLGVGFVNKTVSELAELFRQTESSPDRQAILQGIDHLLNLAEAMGKIVVFGQFSPFYIKSYEDDLPRKSGVIKNYRFYDEREWCYVPESLQTSNDLYKNEQQYNEWRQQNENKPLIEDVSLDFDFSDITHLIVEKKEDIRTLAGEIEIMPGHKITSEQKELLIKKITLFESLK